MFQWHDDLSISGTKIFIDSKICRPLCFVSHGHSDHIAQHEHAVCTPETAALAEYRVGVQRVTEIRYGQTISVGELDPHVSLTALPAGHVLGSAMLLARRDDGQSLLYTGDYKLRHCLTVPPAELAQADVLVMESTYGLPFFRFPPRESSEAQLLDLVESAFCANRQPIVMGYSLGKAQEAVRMLTAAGHAVTCHGAVHAMCKIYNDFGVDLGAYRRYRFEDFHGPAALDLRERGVLVAPPNCARAGFATRFENPCRIVMTGWALLKGATYRYGVEHAVPISDHADFDELIETVERVAPKKVYTHHGYPEFADTLRARGIDATLARPDPQMLLFGE